MASSYTQVHRVQSEVPKGATGWWCNWLCNCTQCNRLVTGLGSGYSITSGARCWCHLGRRISLAWVLRYSITSGARYYCHLGRRISIAWALRYSISSGARCRCHLGRKISREYRQPGRRGSVRPVARPKSQRVQNHLQWSPQGRAATMASSYILSTQGAKRSARGCNGTRRGCNCTNCTCLATGLLPNDIVCVLVSACMAWIRRRISIRDIARGPKQQVWTKSAH